MSCVLPHVGDRNVLTVAFCYVIITFISFSAATVVKMIYMLNRCDKETDVIKKPHC